MVITDYLVPQLDLLRQEFVLIQAWKKTASYIRYHNWFSDTLQLDRTAINLRAFIAEIQEKLQTPDTWESTPLRIVPAPKTQQWHVSARNTWEPVLRTAGRLRPLAHVSLRDQVVATAMMLCLADDVETRQGNSAKSAESPANRIQVVSYGNRLFCDPVGLRLQHRWGSAKLYRSYYSDYRTFLSRPEIVARSIARRVGERIFIVQADLRQFYDRVRPDRLTTSVRSLHRDAFDPRFFDFATRVLNWGWHAHDEHEVAIYAQQAGIEDFSRVSLPQGLVAAGFFANIVLLHFDRRLADTIGLEVAPGIRLNDACRYVDDLRFVVSVDQPDLDIEQITHAVVGWLQTALQTDAPGLELAQEKTTVAEFGGHERPLVRQSLKMGRIQSAVSGGFDAIGGEEILDSIQGLLRSQQALNDTEKERGWRFSPLPDVRDDTVSRFAAARYRTTCRSIRPLLEDGSEQAGLLAPFQLRASTKNTLRTQTELDEDTRAFAFGLVERWVKDPSNVRLLRIGLDLWPDAEILKAVLNLLRPFTEKGGRRKGPRRVAWYCLSEILRAGATETGMVADAECLPAAINLSAYRAVLVQEATRLASLALPTIPWYLRQQAFLFLAACDPASAPVVQTGRSEETQNYREMIRFLRGEGPRLKSGEFATLAVLARRGFANYQRSIQLTRQGLTAARKREIAERDPSFALELIADSDQNTLFPFHDLPARVREDLCLDVPTDGLPNLADVVLKGGPNGNLRNELSLLRFATAFLKEFRPLPSLECITPGQVRLQLDTKTGTAHVVQLKIQQSRASTLGSLYRAPQWCPEENQWRFHLGFLLRFILSGKPDFTRRVPRANWRENANVYRAVESHWYQRIYGLFNGQSAFGDDWLPITDWLEHFLSALLHWPGCQRPKDFHCVTEGIDATLKQIEARISILEAQRGVATGTLLLPMIANRPSPAHPERPLRACIVQTAIPAASDFHMNDLELGAPAIRRKHRNHLSAALAAVDRMLALRATHNGSDASLDWLILPELAVHPSDIKTHLIPFARKHRTLILAGLTYEQLSCTKGLVNSALWIIPEWSVAHGLQVRTRRQGKYHLAPDEEAFNHGKTRIEGFRPCQWLIGYPWSDHDRPLLLTASVCYDATDLSIAADLRDHSDVFAIPALNKDVNTFDQMALALHYHMFQLVIVANNGQYGGSNAYWPSSDALKRRIFHLYGQPQAAIAFLDIPEISEFLKRRAQTTGKGAWKYPPAGLSKAARANKQL